MREELVKGRDFVIVGLTPYDVEFGSNCKNIAEEIAKHNRVLYVNRPLDRVSLIKDRKSEQVQKRLKVLKGADDDLLRLDDNLWNLYPKTITESVNWVKVNGIFDFFTKINNQRVGNQIKHAIERLGFKDIILFNDNDFFRSYHLKELIHPSTSIYYIRDYLVGLKYWEKHGRRLEEQLIRKSDATVANSIFLQDYAKQFSSNSHYVGQGCDLSHFDEEKAGGLPSDMQGIAGPVIGYVGALNSKRLSINYLTYIAEEKPEWSIVLVGPEDENFKQSKLHSLSNVHFLGNKNIKELPAYIKYFDVCLNPQEVNALTIGNYPRKIDEYLAMGKPTVATYTKAMEAFEGVVYLADDGRQYVDFIEKALAEDHAGLKKERKAFAAGHTWENSVKEIYKAILKSEEAQQEKTVLEAELSL